MGSKTAHSSSETRNPVVVLLLGLLLHVRSAFCSLMQSIILPVIRIGSKWDQRRKRRRPRNLRDAEDAVAKIAGLWWPRSGSGDFEAEDRRMAKSGNRYLRYYFIQGADRMRHNIPDYADFYARKYRQATKHEHKQALVLTARKSVGLIVGLHRPGTRLHRNEPYRSKEG